MKRETLRKKRINATKKKEYYTQREKYWARLEQEADDAESMKINRKKHITPEQLAVFNSLSEREVEQILAARNAGNAKDTTVMKDTGNEKEEEINENAKKDIS